MRLFFSSTLRCLTSCRPPTLLVAGWLLVLLALSGCQSGPPARQAGSAPPPLARYVAELRAARARQPRPGRYAAGVGIFVDLRRPDTENRLFVLDLRTGRALVAAPCLNGRTDRLGRVRYSNVVNSCCSSRGLAWTSFEQGYDGHFGRAYRLHGLGAGTSNLAARAVVLHSWRYVPPAPVAATAHPIQSWGCPALAPVRLTEVAALLRAQAGRRVLVCLR